MIHSVTLHVQCQVGLLYINLGSEKKCRISKTYVSFIKYQIDELVRGYIGIL